MNCSVCGQEGAWKCLVTDENNNPVGAWIHPHCAHKNGDSVAECNRLSANGLGSMQHHRFPGTKKTSMRNLRFTSTVQRQIIRCPFMPQACKKRPFL